MSNCLFVLESFRRHRDNGRWLFQLGMEAAGYVSLGAGLPPVDGVEVVDTVDVGEAVERFRPGAVIFWPRYEWDSAQWGGSEVTPEMGFRNFGPLLARRDILRVAVFHDAGSCQGLQRAWHEEFKPHVYLVWYHQTAVEKLARWVPRERMVRTWHVVDGEAVPATEARAGVCCVSGNRHATIYPLRERCYVAAAAGKLGGTVGIPCPAYHQNGGESNEFLRTLAQYRVAICTASIYEFALRKIVEATAAGCRVITDLPGYDCLPGIDGNLIRVQRGVELGYLRDLIEHAAATWSLETQRHYAREAAAWYDYRAECGRLAKELAGWRARM